MLVRELFTSLGLKVDESSFAKGEAAIGVVKAGLGLLFDNALNVGVVLSKAFFAMKNHEGVAAATKATVDQLQIAADKADTIQGWIATHIELVWAKLLKTITPAIQYIVNFFYKNALFVASVFEKLYEIVSRNWNTARFIIAGGAAALIGLFVALKWAAIKSAAASAAAWLAAAWPFILIGGLIAGLLVAIDDIRVYLAGGDSLIGRYKKRLDAWLAPNKKDPGWLAAIKSWIHLIGAALSKQGVIENFFGSIWAWLKKIGGSIYDFFAGPASSVWDFLKGINWEAAWIEFKMAALEVWEFVKIVLKMLGFDVDKAKDKLANTNWKSVWINFKISMLEAYYKAKYVALGIVNFFHAVYNVIHSVVDAVERAIAAIERFGGAVGGALKKVGHLFGPQIPNQGEPEAPITSSGPSGVPSRAPAIASWVQNQSTSEAQGAVLPYTSVSSQPASSVENSVEINLYGHPEENRRMVQEELNRAGVIRSSDVDHAVASTVATE